MKKMLIIINPIAGTTRKGLIVTQAIKLLDRSLYDFEITVSTRKGHASELAARAAKEGVDVVVAVGGDGTVNEIAGSLIHTDTALGIIPCGSGNGLARHLKISMTPSRAIDILNYGSVATIDYGRVNGHPFFCTCGVGFDASVSMEFAKSGRRGLVAYLEKGILQWLTYKPENYELITDNSRQKHKALFITCGNASQWGNDGYITPNASLTDGLMDVTIMEPFLAIEVGPMAIQLLNRTINRNPHARMFKCDHLVIHRSHESAVHFDGDPTIMGKEVEVKMVPKGLKIIVPSKSITKI